MEVFDELLFKLKIDIVSTNRVEIKFDKRKSTFLYD